MKKRVMKKKGITNDSDSTRLRHTHLKVFPLIDNNGQRQICFCSYSGHHGIVRSGFLERGKHCIHGCGYFREHNLSYRGVDEEALYLMMQVDIERARGNNGNGNGHVIPIAPSTDEDGREFYWVLDRGDIVYLARHNKLGRIENIEKDHYKFYTNKKPACSK